MVDRFGLALKRRISPRWTVARELRAAGLPLVLASVVVQSLLGLLPVGFVLLSSFALGRVPAAVAGGTDSTAWHLLRTDLVFAAVVLVVAQVLAPVQGLIRRQIQLRVDANAYDRLLRACFLTAGTKELARPEIQANLDEVLHSLRSDRASPGAAAGAMPTVVTRYISFVSAAAIVGVVFSWWAAAGLAMAGLGLRHAHRRGQANYLRVLAGHAPLRRRAWYLRELSLGSTVAKESRVFGLATWLAERTAAARVAASETVWRAHIRIFGRPFLVTGSVAVFAAAICVAAVGAAAGQGSVSLTSLGMVSQLAIAVVAIGSFFDDSDVEIAHGSRGLAGLIALEEAMTCERAREMQRLSTSGKADPAGLPRREVRFEGVRFSYPGADSAVLCDFDLRIEAGTSLALVGLNGVGKTTLLKLLARFHEVDAGAVRVDGIDICDFDPRQWQRRIAAIFQDFGHYELSAADNIGFGAVELMDDPDRIRAAAERAGAATFLDALGNGMGTTLSRAYTDGADLSGGQWQRVALARALLAVDAGASILLLDEPTANLDVQAEAAFIDQFLEITKGITTIVVSHRFATVRRADRIVVLDAGRIVEDGTHEDLLASGGRYSDLFTLQAARFACAGSERDA